MKKAELKKQLLGHLNELFLPYGFNKKDRNNAFVYRETEDGLVTIFPALRSYGEQHSVGWVIGIQFKSLEEIFAKFWGGKRDKTEVNLTYGLNLGDKMLGGKAYFDIDSIEDLENMFKACSNDLVQMSLKYIAEHNTLEYAEHYFNVIVVENSKNSFAPNIGSAFEGLIAAKLLNKPNFEELVRFYESKIKSYPEIHIKHYYPGKFNNLVDYLRTL